MKSEGKSAISLIIGGLKQKSDGSGYGMKKPMMNSRKDDDESSSEDDFDTSASETAAQELIDAVKSDDASAVVKAFTALMECCSSEGDD